MENVLTDCEADCTVADSLPNLDDHEQTEDGEVEDIATERWDIVYEGIGERTGIESALVDALRPEEGCVGSRSVPGHEVRKHIERCRVLDLQYSG